MRVYTRETFLALPSGVIFSKGGKWFWGVLCVKGDTIYLNGCASDFLVLDINNIESHDSGDLFDRLERMLVQGVSYPMDDSYGRDGLFDADDLFLVFEPSDLLSLMAHVAKAMEVSRPGYGLAIGV